MIGERDPTYLRSDQYRDSRNLETRISFYQRYATNPREISSWILEQVRLPDRARVLEVGCGIGEFWARNLPRVPAGWEILLTDFSEGVMSAARERLSRAGRPFGFRVADVQDLPFPEGSFDGVLANHMLYHVPDLESALREIARVLTGTGRLYASTNGAGHLAEIYELERIFRVSPDEHEHARFTCENGASILGRYFRQVRFLRFDDSVIATSRDDVVRFVLSRVPEAMATPERTATLQAKVARLFEEGGGQLRAGENIGLFEGSEPWRPGTVSEEEPAV